MRRKPDEEEVVKKTVIEMSFGYFDLNVWPTYSFEASELMNGRRRLKVADFEIKANAPALQKERHLND